MEILGMMLRLTVGKGCCVSGMSGLLYSSKHRELYD